MPRSWMQGPVVDPFVQLDASVAVPARRRGRGHGELGRREQVRGADRLAPGEFSFVNVAVIVDVPLATCAGATVSAYGLLLAATAVVAIPALRTLANASAQRPARLLECASLRLKSGHGSCPCAPASRSIPTVPPGSRRKCEIWRGRPDFSASTERSGHGRSGAGSTPAKLAPAAICP